MNYFAFVEVFQSEHYARGIEDGSRFGESICGHLHLKVTTDTIFHHETGVIFGLIFGKKYILNSIFIA